MAGHADPHGTKWELSGHWGLGLGSRGGKGGGTSGGATELGAGPKVAVGEREDQALMSPRGLGHQSCPSQDLGVMPQSLTPQNTAPGTLEMAA